MKCNASDTSILLIDDSSVMRVMAREMLKKLGFPEENLDEAFCGKSGWEKIEKKPQYDLILLDWSMPGMDGMDVLKAIRTHKDSKISSVPVVMITAESLKKNIYQAAEAGATAYIAKPFNLEVLKNTLGKVFR